MSPEPLVIRHYSSVTTEVVFGRFECVDLLSLVLFMLSIQFNSVQVYLYRSKYQQKYSKGTLHIKKIQQISLEQPLGESAVTEEKLPLAYRKPKKS